MIILKGSRQLAVISLAVLVVLLTSLSWALTDTSPPLEEWSRTFGGSGEDRGFSVQVTSDGGYIITGSTNSFGAGGTDVYLVKTDSSGNLEWEKTFGGTEEDVGRSVQVTNDGGYIITGETQSYGAGGRDVYLVKTDSQGLEEWSRTFGGSSTDEGYSVQVTSDGGYIITGKTYSFGAGGRDVYLVKTDSGGVEEWSSAFGGSGYDEGQSVQETSDGGYIITGSTESFGAGEYDVYLVKTNPQGIMEWNRTFGGPSTEYGRSVQETSDGGYIITGQTTSFGAGWWDVYLVRTDSHGEEEWNRTFGGPSIDEGQSVQETSDGGYIIAGYTHSFGAGSNDVYLVKTNPQGEEEWNMTFGGSEEDIGRSVQETSDGGYIIAGYTESSGVGGSDVYLVKTHALSYLTIRELALYEGWNFIGLPLTPEDPSIGVVLAEVLDKVTVVWAFDGETEIWSSYSPDVPMVLNDLNEMVDDKGYWIQLTEDATLTVQGETANTSENTLFEGWTLISLPLTPEDSSIQVILADILDKITVVWAFDGETEIWSSYSPDVPMVLNDLTEMVDDKGYWIKVTEDATLTVAP